MDDIERALGRIEQKVDSLKENIEGRLTRLNDHLFQEGGLEPRVLDLEKDVVAIKTKTSIAAAIVSAVVTSLFMVAGWIIKK